MRKLVWFALGFAAAAAVTAYLFSGILLLLLGILLLAAAVLLRFAFSTDIAKHLAVIVCGAAMGLLWFQIYDMQYLATARQMDQQTAAVSVRCTDYSFYTGYGTGIDGEIVLNGKTYKTRIYLDEEQNIAPGTVLHGLFRFRYTSAGGSKEPTYHRGQGIFLMAYQEETVKIVPPATEGLRYGAARLRHRILNIIETIFPVDVAPFVKALLLGDTTDLDYRTETHLMLSGIRHVAAVSGLHVSILFSLLYFISGRKRFLSAIVGIPCLVIFAALAGFSASVVRACIMQGLMLVALMLNKEYDPPSALGFAVVVMLVANPQSITSVGFQLSVTSVSGIFLFSKRIYSYLTDSKRPWGSINPKLLRFIAGSVSISLASQVFTLPLTALYFGAISLVGPLTNLLCLWAVTYLFCGIIAAVIGAFIYLPLGRILSWLVSWVARYVLGVSGLLAKIPCAAVFTESIYIVLWLIFCYVILLVFFRMRNKRPMILAACAVLSLCVSLLASWVEPLLDNCRMMVLDVGQGQCILLQSGGKTYMVDCGGDSDDTTADKAAAVLSSQGIYRLDGLILTHSDRDHAGAATRLLSRIPAEVVIVPSQQEESLYSQLRTVHTGRWVQAEQNLQIQWDNAVIRIFTAENPKSENESSLCVLFQYQECDILITGDRSKAGELELLRSNYIPDIDVLVVGHHGAKDATGDLLLGTVKPETAVISVSAYNSFGHPAQEVLQRLHDYGCTVYRTDLHGTVVIRR